MKKRSRWVTRTLYKYYNELGNVKCYPKFRYLLHFRTELTLIDRAMIKHD